MEKIVSVLTLDYGILSIKVPTPKKYNLEFIRDEVEEITNIIGPHQFYFYHGKEVQDLESQEWTMANPLDLIENNVISVNRFLIRFRNRIFPIYISDFEKKYLLCLKLAIEKKFSSLGIDCPFDSQTLKINYQELPSSLPLCELPYNTEIDLELNSFIPQKFNITIYDLKEISEAHKVKKTALMSKGAKFEVKVDSRCSKWRMVSKGLSIQCYCRNRECEARNRTVVVNLGFGVFSIDSIKTRTFCPICEEVCQELTNAGFYFAGWKFRGVINEISESGEEKTWDHYYLWREFFNEWTELQFSVRPNEN